MLHLLTGDDDAAIFRHRTTLLEHINGVEMIDLNTDLAGATSALASPALFGDRRTLDLRACELRAVDADHLLKSLNTTNARVVLSLAGKPHPAITGRFTAAGFEHTDLRVPRQSALPAMITAELDRAGVRTSGRAKAMLIELAVDHLDRVRGVINLCRRLRMLEPDERQLRVLLGTSAASAAPWHITDALEQGRIAEALDAAGQLDPQKLLSWMCNRATDVATAAEALRAGTDAAAQIGGPPWKARATVEAGRRIEPHDARRYVADAVRTTSAARGDLSAQTAVEIAIARRAI